MRQIAHRQAIAASPSAVWAVISRPGHLAECHPFCAANPVQQWPGAGSVDHLEYLSGRVITRRFVAWDEGTGYDIDITDANGDVAGVSWRLEEDEDGSALTISVTPRMLGTVPAALRWLPERALVRPRLTRYLRAVLAGIEWRVTTGRPVRPDQFGSVRWFSAP